MWTVPINATAAGANQIVAGVPGRRIVILGYVLCASAAVTAQWVSGAVNISGPMSLTAAGDNISAGPGRSEVGFFRWGTGATGGDLTLTLGGAVQVGGHLTYTFINPEDAP